MSSAVIVPFPVGVNLYQMLLDRSCPAHDGLGSVASVVAKEVSLLSVKGVGTALIALAKLSFAGGWPKFRWKTALPKLPSKPLTMKKYGTPAVAGKFILWPPLLKMLHATSVKAP